MPLKNSDSKKYTKMRVAYWIRCTPENSVSQILRIPKGGPFGFGEFEKAPSSELINIVRP